MAVLSVPRTELTKRLERSKRQFFQWFYLEKRPIRWIKAEMDKLTLALRNITGDDFETDESKWRGRQRRWNKIEWKIKRRDRGHQIPVPIEIIHLPLWRKDNEDVGYWRTAAPVLIHRALNTVVIEDNGQSNTDRRPERNLCLLNGYEYSDNQWSGSEDFSQSRNLSISSWGSQCSSASYHTDYPLIDCPVAFTTKTIQRPSPTFDNSVDLYHPQLPLYREPIFNNGYTLQQEFSSGYNPSFQAFP